MSKVTKKDRIDHLEFQVEWLTDAVHELQGTENLESKPQLKQLDQSAFDHPYATDRFKYVALNADGQAVFFESKPVISNCLDIWVVHTGSLMPMLKGYDTSNWQNSLIEREQAKQLLEVDLSSELTGSDLCRAMLKRGDKCVLIRMGARSDKQAKEIGRFAIAISVDKLGCFNVISDQQTISKADFAVPINNKGEPLTAAEVGL